MQLSLAFMCSENYSALPSNERGIVRWLAIFFSEDTFPERSLYNRRCRQLRWAIKWIRHQLAKRGQHHAYAVVDSLLIPLCHPARMSRVKHFRGVADIGYCASKQMHFYGLKAYIQLTIKVWPWSMSSYQLRTMMSWWQKKSWRNCLILTHWQIKDMWASHWKKSSNTMRGFLFGLLLANIAKHRCLRSFCNWKSSKQSFRFSSISFDWLPFVQWVFMGLKQR